MKINFYSSCFNIFVFIFSALSTHGQIIDKDFISHHQTLQKRLSEYDNWLQKSGLSQVLKTHEIITEKDSVSIYLKFTYQNVDSATAAWDMIKQKFEASLQDTIENYFEKSLFFSMLNFLRVEPTKANLQIYDTYDLSQDVCLFIGIRTLGKHLEVKKKVCRANSSIDITLEEILNSSNGLNTYLTENDLLSNKNTSKFLKNFKKKKLNKYIEKVITQKYNSLDKGKFNVLSGVYEDFFEFELKGVRGYVFTDKDTTWFCKLMNTFFSDLNCDHRPREWLKIKIEFIPTENGIRFNSSLIAKHATGMFTSVRDNAYINMEPYYIEQVEAFLRQFNNDFYNDFFSLTDEGSKT